MGGPAEGLARLERAAESGEVDVLCARHRVRLLTVVGSTSRGEPELPAEMTAGDSTP